MNFGRIAVAFVVLSGLAAGIGVWWFQTRAFYDDPAALESVTLTVNGVPVALYAEGTSIDAGSSPLRYRACFRLLVPLPGTPTPAPEGAVPTIAPDWFDCYDAGDVAADLSEGRAVPVLAEADVAYGIDRVGALYPDGRGFLWHQINRCGEEVFDGRPAPEGCPPPPEAGPPAS